MAKAGTITGPAPARQNQALRTRPCYRILNKRASNALAGVRKKLNVTYTKFLTPPFRDRTPGCYPKHLSFFPSYSSCKFFHPLYLFRLT